MLDDLKKELVLINPKCGNFIFRNVTLLVEKFFPPISLLTLAALTPQDYKITIHNLKTFWPRKIFRKNILVGITCFSASAKRAYGLAKRYKDAGAYVVMGGPHVSFLPEEARAYCHSVVIGEAESVWAEVLRDYEKNSLKAIYRGEPLEDFFTPVSGYFKKLRPTLLAAHIQTTRGCKNACEFCVVPNKKLRFVNREQVIELIKIIKKTKKRPLIYFKDDNIFSSPHYAKSLFKALIPLKIKWFSFCSIDIAQDDEALTLAKESGCVELTFGFETIFPDQLAKAKNRGIFTSEDYIRLIKKVKSRGIRCRGAFMMGFDHDHILDYFRFLVFLVRARLYFVVLGIITPFPGTRLSLRLQKENRILTTDWNKYDCLHTVFRPVHMSALMLSALFVVMRVITFFLGMQSLPLGIAFFVFIWRALKDFGFLA